MGVLNVAGLSWGIRTPRPAAAVGSAVVWSSAHADAVGAPLAAGFCSARRGAEGRVHVIGPLVDFTRKRPDVGWPHRAFERFAPDVGDPAQGRMLASEESRSRCGDEFVDDPLGDADGVGVGQREDEVLEAGVDGAADGIAGDVGIVV